MAHLCLKCLKKKASGPLLLWDGITFVVSQPNGLIQMPMGATREREQLIFTSHDQQNDPTPFFFGAFCVQVLTYVPWLKMPFNFRIFLY
jgi:hypothetical protein